MFQHCQTSLFTIGIAESAALAGVKEQELLPPPLETGKNNMFNQ
jgi:hypothetical protein